MTKQMDKEQTTEPSDPLKSNNDTNQATNPESKTVGNFTQRLTEALISKVENSVVELLVEIDKSLIPECLEHLRQQYHEGFKDDVKELLNRVKNFGRGTATFYLSDGLSRLAVVWTSEVDIVIFPINSTDEVVQAWENLK